MSSIMQYVYVVTGNNDNIYVEQAWASIWSLKHFNPDAHVIVITDVETSKYIEEIPALVSLLYHVKVVEFDQGMSSMIRSRWLKTSMRQLVDGDFIFIDSDTIITSNLSELEQTKADLGLVLDMHVEFPNHCYHRLVSKLIKKIYKEKTEKVKEYYNSGLIFCRDTKQNREFFRRWHENWKTSKNQGINFDQMSLLKTCMEFPNLATPISGIYNCQLTYNIRYFYEAKIVHFQRVKNIGEPICEFYTDEIYKKIQKTGEIESDVIEHILACKSNFAAIVTPINKQDFRLLKSFPVAFLKIICTKLGLL